MSCPSDNAQAVDQTTFWGHGFHHWDAHRIGWAIAGGCSVLTVVISLISVINHCRNYTNRAEQRQILRILYMPPVYAVVSFFSYRYFRSYTYYSLAETVYEAITLSAFLLLLVEYVASTAIGHSTQGALARKDKRPLPIPFCCWRYRPSKPYFMYALKWSVMQYVVIRPLVTIAGIVAKPTTFYALWSLQHSLRQPVPRIRRFVSISIALYGLILFYGLTKEELVGRRPLAKFLSIKLIVMFTFYQSFVFNLLTDHVIHGTEFWTPTNISDGLNALAICIEMIFFSIFMMWSFPWKSTSCNRASRTPASGAHFGTRSTFGTLPSRSGPNCPISAGVSPAEPHLKPRNRNMGRLLASPAIALLMASHARCICVTCCAHEL
ncbi:organic solute transporter Ostalpha-domain-containing protein [Lactarius quietus]|nr:organic solute transporter Ostalpha-domain-containing protein [Lactarius quietus]